MAKFKFTTLVGADDIETAKFHHASGTFTDADLGKPVKMSASVGDCYELCADGDGIDGFMNSLEPATLDGKQYGTVQVGGRMKVQASGASTLLAFVEAGAVAAPGTAETNGLGLVSTHTMDDTSAATLLADMFQKQWRIITATRVDGTVDDADLSVIIEKL